MEPQKSAASVVTAVSGRSREAAARPSNFLLSATDGRNRFCTTSAGSATVHLPARSFWVPMALSMVFHPPAAVTLHQTREWFLRLCLSFVQEKRNAQPMRLGILNSAFKLQGQLRCPGPLLSSLAITPSLM